MLFEAVVDILGTTKKHYMSKSTPIDVAPMSILPRDGIDPWPFPANASYLLCKGFDIMQHTDFLLIYGIYPRVFMHYKRFAYYFPLSNDFTLK